LFDNYLIQTTIQASVALIVVAYLAIRRPGFYIPPDSLRYLYASIFQGLAALAGIMLVFLTLAHQRSGKATEEARSGMRNCLEKLEGGYAYNTDPLDWSTATKWLAEGWAFKGIDPQARKLKTQLEALEVKLSINPSEQREWDEPPAWRGGLVTEASNLHVARDRVKALRDTYYRAGVMIGRHDYNHERLGTSSWNTIIVVSWLAVLMLFSLFGIVSLIDRPQPPFVQSGLAIVLVAFTFAAIVHFMAFTIWMVGFLLEDPRETELFQLSGLPRLTSVDELLARARNIIASNLNQTE
jgi:hypothetical protein